MIKFSTLSTILSGMKTANNGKFPILPTKKRIWAYQRSPQTLVSECTTKILNNNKDKNRKNR